MWKHTQNVAIGLCLIIVLWMTSIYPVQTLVSYLDRNGGWTAQHQKVWQFVYAPHERMIAASPEAVRDIDVKLIDVFHELGR